MWQSTKMKRLVLEQEPVIEVSKCCLSYSNTRFWVNWTMWSPFFKNLIRLTHVETDSLIWARKLVWMWKMIEMFIGDDDDDDAWLKYKAKIIVSQ